MVYFYNFIFSTSIYFINNRQESAKVFEEHMARVKRNEIEMERKNNAKEEEIQQVLQDRYNAAQAKIENKRQESNAILKLNKELAEIRTKNEKQQRQDEHAADKANFDNHFNLRFGTSLI